MNGIKKLLLPLAYIFLLSINAQSQRTARFYITVENTTVDVEILNTLDTLGINNKLSYNVSFNISISNTNETKSVLSLLQSSLKTNKSIPLALTLTTIDYDGFASEERIYDNANVKMMQLSELNGTLTTPLKILVSLTAEKMQAIYNSKRKISITNTNSSNTALAGNFRVQFASLPTSKIVKVLPMQINGQNISFQMSNKSDAVFWQEMLTKNAISNAVKLQGFIELLNTSLTNAIIKINITDAEIIAYSPQYISDASGNLKYTVTLRVKNIAIDFVK